MNILSQDQTKTSNAKFLNVILQAPMPTAKFQGFSFILEIVNKTALGI
jgi:hypothetical protein